MVDLSRIYRDYIACLNAQDWPMLGRFVADDVIHNERRVGLAGYRQMLERDFAAIPDLRFQVSILVADARCVASRIGFDCTPTGTFLGFEVNGRRVTFSENVIYEFQGGKIARVWSIIDRAAVEAALR